MTVKLTATGKNDKPVTGAVAGTFAVFDAGVDGTDYAPFLDPKANLSKVAFHSALDYLGLVTTMTATVSLPSGSFGAGVTSTTLLGAHGQSGRPLVLAEFSADGGANWWTINGSTWSQIGYALVGTVFNIQVDSTNVYLFMSRSSTVAAQTLNFRIHILRRNFGETRPNNGIAFKATPSYIEAAGGVFDTRRRYLQTPAAGQTPDITHCSGATLLLALGDEASGTEVDMGLGNHGNNVNVPLMSTWNTSWPPYITQANKVPLVFQAPGLMSSRARFEAGSVKMSDSSGVTVFDTSRKMVAFVKEITTSVSIPTRAAASNDVPHEVVHYTTPVPAGADMIFGWIELQTSSLTISTYQPIDFSGGIYMSGIFHAPSYVMLRAASIIYPRIVSGNLQIVEQYYNRSVSGSGTESLPSYTADVHMFVCATTGGF